MTTSSNSPWTAALLDLTVTLSDLGADDDLIGMDWFCAVSDAFMSTPFLHDLDPFMYDALLTWAGHDLTTGEGLACAAALTAILTAAGFVSIQGGAADQQSAVCELAASEGYEPHRSFGQEFSKGEEAEEFHAELRRRTAAYLGQDINDSDPGEWPEAA